MGYPTLYLPKEKHEALRKFLGSLNCTFEDRPYQVFLARAPGITVNLYNNGKVVFGGSDDSAIKTVYEHTMSLGSSVTKKPEKELEPLEILGTRIGTDETGKGDYFGPLVVAGVLVDDEIEKQLIELGVKDSKLLSDTKIRDLAYEIRRICERKRFEEIWITPLKYNILYKKLKNVNKILGWAHARVIENLLANGIECRKAIADQFGDPGYVKHALMARGKRIELIQVPKAERDIAVAAASILARDVFIRKMEELGESYSMEFPKGASHVLEFGKKLVQTHGIDILAGVAKLHFSTTSQITGGILPQISSEVEREVDLMHVPIEKTEKEKQDARLECYNLISAFEVELRSFIKRELSQHFGEKWWEKCVLLEVRIKCEKRAESERKKGRKVELVECLEFPHYQRILTVEPNWSEVFQKFLRNKEQLTARLTILKEVRDAVSHSRGEIGPKEKAEVVAAIGHIRKFMLSQANLEDFA